MGGGGLRWEEVGWGKDGRDIESWGGWRWLVGVGDGDGGGRWGSGGRMMD